MILSISHLHLESALTYCFLKKVISAILRKMGVESIQQW